MLARRDSFVLISQYINPKNYSREFAILYKQIKGYYDRDATAQSINREIFVALLEESFTNKKHITTFMILVDEAYALETSTANIDQLILSFMKSEVGSKLAQALANKDDKVMDYVEEYTHLHSMATLDDLNDQGTEILEGSSWDEIMEKELARVGSLSVYPLAINNKLGGRLNGGHHIVTFARPEMGKTALNLTIACGFARQGASGIYFINEDRVEDLYLRAVSNLTGLTEQRIRDNPAAARELALSRGLGNIRFISLSPGTLRQVEAFVEKFRPAWVVMDQLRNLSIKDSNKVLQLEYATSGMRTLGKKYNCIVISTTQAGDSAEGKAVLDMGDVDFSNTGVAAQADVLLGVGATADQYEKGLRTIHLSKNKITGDHATFMVQLDPFISRYRSIGNEG